MNPRVLFGSPGSASQAVVSLHSAADGRRAAGSGPRLLFVVRGAEDYGTYRQVVGSMEGLSALGCAVDLYALGPGDLVERARAMPGIVVQCDPEAPPRFVARQGNMLGKLLPFARLQLAGLRMIGRLSAYLRSHRYNALVICEHGLLLPVAAIGRQAGLKTIWLMANLVSTTYPLDLNRRLYAFAFRHFGAIPIANSAYTLQTLGRGASYAHRIELGVDPADIDIPGDAPPTAIPGSFPPDAVRLLVMGRMVPNKGQLVLLRALLSDRVFADMHLILCGGPLGTEYETELRREAEAHGAADRLHIVGPVRNVRTYYERADIVVNARLDPEPFGLSVVEAMIAGKPVLAHALGGPAETVIDGETGWHVAAPTREAFAAGLRRMLADRPRWAAMGRAGAERAAATYSTRNMSEQLLSAIRGSL